MNVYYKCQENRLFILALCIVIMCRQQRNIVSGTDFAENNRTVNLHTHTHTPHTYTAQFIQLAEYNRLFSKFCFK